MKRSLTVMQQGYSVFGLSSCVHWSRICASPASSLGLSSTVFLSLRIFAPIDLLSNCCCYGMSPMLRPPSRDQIAQQIRRLRCGSPGRRLAHVPWKSNALWSPFCEESVLIDLYEHTYIIAAVSVHCKQLRCAIPMHVWCILHILHFAIRWLELCELRISY